MKKKKKNASVHPARQEPFLLPPPPGRGGSLLEDGLPSLQTSFTSLSHLILTTTLESRCHYPGLTDKITEAPEGLSDRQRSQLENGGLH